MEEDQVEDDFMPGVGKDVPEDEDVVVEESYQGGTTNDSIPTLPRADGVYLSCSATACPCRVTRVVLSLSEISIRCLPPFNVRLMHCCPKALAVDGKYLCHPQNHFAGLHAAEGYFQHFDSGKVEGGLSSRLLWGDIVPVETGEWCEQRFQVSQKWSAAPMVSMHVLCMHAFVMGAVGTLLRHHVVDAALYGLAGHQEVQVATKQCSSRSCRAVYGYNYVWSNGKKINAVCREDLKDQVLFVNSKCGSTMDYLKYHGELQFRGHVATRAVAHAYNSVFGEDVSVVPGWFRQLHEHALFYKVALQELEVFGLHRQIEIENEVSDEALGLYKALCYGTFFAPPNRSQVTAIVGDGHGQVQVKCNEGAGPKKRGGRPRQKKRKVGRHGNGWFVLCDPKSGRILCMGPMLEPEGNQTAVEAL